MVTAVINIPNPYKREVYYQLHDRQLSKNSAVLQLFHLLVYSVQR